MWANVGGEGGRERDLYITKTTWPLSISNIRFRHLSPSSFEDFFSHVVDRPVERNWSRDSDN